MKENNKRKRKPYLIFFVIFWLVFEIGGSIYEAGVFNYQTILLWVGLLIGIGTVFFGLGMMRAHRKRIAETAKGYEKTPKMDTHAIDEDEYAFDPDDYKL